MNTCVYVVPKDSRLDHRSVYLKQSAETLFGVSLGLVKLVRVFEFDASFGLSFEEKNFVENFLVDRVVNNVVFSESYSEANFASYCVVSKKNGITDDESRCAEKTYEDCFGKKSPKVLTHTLYMFEEKLSEDMFQNFANTVLGNPLIETFTYGFGGISGPYTISKEKAHVCPNTSLKKRTVNPFDLSLNQEEVDAIQKYFEQSDVQNIRKQHALEELTDCEWEILAQTWSEHCKHKEFNADIEFTDLDTGESRTIHSLFHSKIKKATEEIDQSFRTRGRSFLVKVFNDNAGVVRVDDETLFVWKVETHNTPSALDPYGGAMTGVLGVNRDAFGTGIGGARLLFNTNVLCFGSPNYSKPLLKGQKHPRYIREGVVRGVRDAGNQSGVPTVNGSVIYDDRFSGKPLVFCGTGALLPPRYGSREAWGKYVEPGDRILMLGGRVGKDGIHGATASSTHADESTPATIVQIGSPFTQKLLSDFLEYASRLNLVKSCTDNGAGGLSSSIGELAEFTNGARVFLEKVPLKYPGLEAWEIFVSESQERMTLVCEAKHCEELFSLAQKFEVELSDIGEFTNSGFLDVRFGERCLAYLNLEFLHKGVPKKRLIAEWKKPSVEESIFIEPESYNQSLLDLLASDNICSRRAIIRQYDHEVKGRSVLKPLMGLKQTAPQDAAVMRLSFDHYRGIAVSNGIIPRYGDIDPYEMSAGSFDEGVRQIIAVGGRLPDPDDLETNFWSVNDNFCVPNSVYDPASNPDGKLKLGKLVRMCDALYEMSKFFHIPMTSGKDSMKNDFGTGHEKISVPPTILYSMVAGIKDIRRTLSSEWKHAGDLIYQVGQTYEELGASEFYNLHKLTSGKVPCVRREDAKRVYTKFSHAHELELIKSAHDLSDGGLAVALAESCMGSGKGAYIDLKELALQAHVHLFSESHSRFVVSIPKEKQNEFESLMGSDARCIGTVTEDEFLHCVLEDRTLVHCSLQQMLEAWERDAVWSV